jgi:hypothetical protein
VRSAPRSSQRRPEVTTRWRYWRGEPAETLAKAYR